MGSSVSLVILGLGVVMTVIPALIHTFLPDGGANVIAGMGVDLDSEHGQRVVALMAWAGATQLAWGGSDAERAFPVSQSDTPNPGPYCN